MKGRVSADKTLVATRLTGYHGDKAAPSIEETNQVEVSQNKANLVLTHGTEIIIPGGEKSKTETINVFNNGTGDATKVEAKVANPETKLSLSKIDGTIGAQKDAKLEVTATSDEVGSEEIKVKHEAGSEVITTSTNVAYYPENTEAKLQVLEAKGDLSYSIQGITSQKIITITNNGIRTIKDLKSNLVPVAGMNISDTKCNGELSKGASCAITIEYNPIEDKNLADSVARLNITGSYKTSSGYDKVVTLWHGEQYSVSAGASVVSVTPNPDIKTLTTAVGKTNTLGFTVKNTGPSQLKAKVTGLDLTNATTAYLAPETNQANNCTDGFELNADKECTIQYKHTPLLEHKTDVSLTAKYKLIRNDIEAPAAFEVVSKNINVVGTVKAILDSKVEADNSKLGGEGTQIDPYVFAPVKGGNGIKLTYTITNTGTGKAKDIQLLTSSFPKYATFKGCGDGDSISLEPTKACTLEVVAPSANWLKFTTAHNGDGADSTLVTGTYNIPVKFSMDGEQVDVATKYANYNRGMAAIGYKVNNNKDGTIKITAKVGAESKYKDYISYPVNIKIQNYDEISPIINNAKPEILECQISSKDKDTCDITIHILKDVAAATDINHSLTMAAEESGRDTVTSSVNINFSEGTLGAHVSELEARDEYGMVFDYNEDGKSIIITGYNSEKDHQASPEIPQFIDNKPVTVIGQFAFLRKHLKSIIIPEGVLEIGKGAFVSNTFSSITIPNSTKIIGNEAFAENHDLTELHLGDNLETIGNSAFGGTSITKLNIPNKVKTIGRSAFFQLGITELKLGSSVEKIGASAFKNTGNWTQVQIC